LEPKRNRCANFQRWLSAGCALALMCASASPAVGQGSTADSKTSNGAKVRTVHSTPARSTATKATTAKSATAKTGTAKSGTKSETAANSTKASSKRRTTAAAKGSRTGSAAARAHAASHPPASQHTRSTLATVAHSNSKYASSRKSGNKKTTARGQQKIEPERAQAIQEALIREHYLSGESAGTWNESSEDAMRRYQADHGWQSKVVPDSRALISLGLGPSHDHLLNPESAMTTEPTAPHAESLAPTSHSADPGTSVIPVAPVATTPPENPSKPQ